MKTCELSKNKYMVLLADDDLAYLRMFIASLDSPRVASIEDVITLLCCYACDHCTDHLEEVRPDVDIDKALNSG